MSADHPSDRDQNRDKTMADVNQNSVKLGRNYRVWLQWESATGKLAAFHFMLT